MWPVLAPDRRRGPWRHVRAAGDDLDAPRPAVDPYTIAGGDPGRRNRGADHGRDTELAREDGRMRGRPARVCHEPGDLGEEHNPRRVRHLADEDVPFLDLVELVDGPNHPSRTLENAR